MGSSASKRQTGDNVSSITNPTTINETSSGFHVFELHVPTAGKGLLILAVIAVFAWACWRIAHGGCSAASCLDRVLGPHQHSGPGSDLERGPTTDALEMTDMAERRRLRREARRDEIRQAIQKEILEAQRVNQTPDDRF